MSQLIVAIDAREMVGQLAGKGRYVAEVVKGLGEIDSESQYLLYTKAPLGPEIKLPKNFTNLIIGGLPGLRQLWLALDAKKRGCHVMWSPTGYLPIVFSIIPTVVTIHDLAIFTTPEAKPALKTLLAEKLLLGAAVAKAKKILAVSQSTKKDLVRLFSVPAAKITATLLGYDQSAYRPKAAKDTEVLSQYQLAPGYMLFIGTLEPRKNIEGIIRAFSKLPLEVQHKHKLVIAGKKGWYYESIFRTVEELELEHTVQFLGRVPDEHLPALYRQSHVFVFPSFYEGFGLPPLEAIACGTPVISSNISSLPEVVGTAGILINPHKIDQITQAMLDVGTDTEKYNQLKSNCADQAAQFSWQKTAEQTHTVLKSFQP